MKAVKFAICCMLTLLIMFLPLRAYASGEISAAALSSRYARADAKDIYFCERKDLNYALFTIPYTYCVEILSADGDWYYVKYAEDNSIYRALYGYCLSKDFTLVDEPPSNIYLFMPVTVTFKTDTPIGSLPVLGELNVTAAFYGTYYSGATAYSYVLYDGSFGYIYGANNDYPLNEIPVEEPLPEEPLPEEPASGSNSKLIIALALTALAAAALILLYLTGRKSRFFRPDG